MTITIGFYQAIRMPEVRCRICVKPNGEIHIYAVGQYTEINELYTVSFDSTVSPEEVKYAVHLYNPEVKVVIK